MNNNDNVWIQLGTRLHMLVYRAKTATWEVWTATNSRSGDSAKWLGTYMELHADGKCEQHYRSEVDIRCITVRPSLWEYVCTGGGPDDRCYFGPSNLCPHCERRHYGERKETE